MVSDTLCPAVHILGTINVYSRVKGIADYYWPRAVFFPYLNQSRAADVRLFGRTDGNSPPVHCRTSFGSGAQKEEREKMREEEVRVVVR